MSTELPRREEFEGRENAHEKMVRVHLCSSCGRMLNEAQDPVSLLLCQYARNKVREPLADVIAFKQEDLERMAVKWCKKWGLPTHLAFDVVAQTLSKIVKGASSFDCNRAAWPWLHTIAYRAFLDVARRELRWRAKSLSADTGDAAEDRRRREFLEPTAPAEDQPLSVALANEERRRLDEAVARLPPKEREVFELRWMGVPNNEVAKIAGCSPSAACERFKRAVRILRDMLR
jgi:RNA polymerase sigma factor (sigma-70 family)